MLYTLEFLGVNTNKTYNPLKPQRLYDSNVYMKILAFKDKSITDTMKEPIYQEALNGRFTPVFIIYLNNNVDLMFLDNDNTISIYDTKQGIDFIKKYCDSCEPETIIIVQEIESDLFRVVDKTVYELENL